MPDVTPAVLQVFRQNAEAVGKVASLAEFPALAREQLRPATWRENAVRLYANWLSFLAEEKAERGQSVSARTRLKAEPELSSAYG